MTGIHFAQDFSVSTSFTWISADAVAALHALGHPVSVQAGAIADSVEPRHAELLRQLQAPARPDQAQVKWTHFWEPYATQRIDGRVNLEVVALNHALARPTGGPTDAWMADVVRSPAHKLPISQFVAEAIAQNGLGDELMSVWNLGYTPEIDEIDEARDIESAPGFRFLHVTNATDPARFGTDLVLRAFADEYRPSDDVSLVVKDYNPQGDAIRELIAAAAPSAPVTYLPEFSSRPDMVRTYRACQGLVAPFRGEGYGIKVLNALACGLPVIAPLFGGITDFCNHDRIFALDYRCADATACVDVQTLGTSGRPLWCEVEIESLRARLREVTDHPKRAASRGRAVERYVKKWFSWADAARALIEIVERLETSDGQTRTADSPAAAGLLV